MHSLPSRRRLPQPNFFRFKCYRLSPLPVPRPPPSLPAPAPSLPGLLPTTHLPINTPPLVSADAHTLTDTLTPAAVCRQARRPPSAHDQSHPHTSGTVRQADARLYDGAVTRQGRRTFSQSANGDSMIAAGRSHPLSQFTPASSRAMKIIFLTCLHCHIYLFPVIFLRVQKNGVAGWCSDEG